MTTMTGTQFLTVELNVHTHKLTQTGLNRAHPFETAEEAKAYRDRMMATYGRYGRKWAVLTRTLPEFETID